MSEAQEQIDRLLNELEDEQRCADAANKLAAIDDPRVFRGFVAALDHRSPTVRTYAVLALADCAKTEAAQSIIPLLGDEDVGVRSSAAFALGKIGDQRCVTALVTTLQGSLNLHPHLCRQLILALADIGGTQSVESILLALQSSFPEVRACAADSLGHVGGQCARGLLLKLLQHEIDAATRETMQGAIDAIGEESK